MDLKRGFGAFLFVLGLSFGAALLSGPVTAEEAAASKEEATATDTSWEADAERAFALKEGLAGKLLQKEEWEEHMERMGRMTDAERDSHVKDIHRSLMRRARLQGIRVPKD